MQDDKVNTTQRVQVSVRPFLVPLLAIAEARLTAKQLDGYTMEGMTARVLSGRLYSKAIDFDERLDFRERAGMSQDEKAIVTPYAELTAKLADVLNLAGLTALAFTNEVKQECRGGILTSTPSMVAAMKRITRPSPSLLGAMQSVGLPYPCEGCGHPATTTDIEGVPLCATCMQDTIVDNVQADLEKLVPNDIIEAMLEPVRQDVRKRYPIEAKHRTYPDTVLGDIDAGDGVTA